MFDFSEFNNKVVVVTGAAQGIGLAVVDALESVGACVVQFDIQFGSDSENRKYGVDVSNSDAVNKAIDQIEECFGDIDYLVNVAGVLQMNCLLDASDKDWERTFAVNVTGAFNVCRAVARKMVPRQRGVIVAVGSNAATVPRIGMGSYAASKAAVTQMIKCLGLELASDNIRCNIVAPGSTDTEMQRRLWTDGDGEKKVIKGSLSSYRVGVPLKRIATTKNIADVVMFLLSSNAEHITLETIVVDGGATLGC